MSSPVWFSIPEFTGIQQHKDGRLLPIGSAYDARNIETRDGNLSVSKGYTRYVSRGYNVNVAQVPDDAYNDQILKLIPYDGGTYDLFVVTERQIYRHKASDNTWSKVQKVSNNDAFVLNLRPIDSPINTLYTKIGNDDVILICSSPLSILKLYPETGRASSFGSGDFMTGVGSGTITAYDSGTLTVTLDWNMTNEFKTQALLRGIVFVHNNVAVGYADVADFPSTTKIALAYAPSVAPSVSDTVYVRGQQSHHHVNIATMYANRLFAAADMFYPTRLYWSAVPGDGRTIEDWTSVEGPEDASGGYVEVGSDSTDKIYSITALSNQLLIWKKRSVWRLLGDRPSTFTLELVGRNAGELSKGVPLVYHDAPYMLTNKGRLVTYDNVDIVPVNSDGNHLERFALGATVSGDFDFATNTYYNGRMYFCGRLSPYPATYFPHNNFIITFDLATGAYMIRDGFEIADLVAFGDDLLLINKDRYVYKFEDGITYNGTKIRAYWQTQPIDFGKKMNVHQVAALYMQLTGKVKIKIDGDYTGSTKEYYVDNSSAFTTRPQFVAVRAQTDQTHVFSFRFDSLWSDNTNNVFAVKGGVNIKALTELKE